MTEKEKMYCETVKIVPDFTRDDMVSPLLFGNNLEHTRSCVNKGISAQMLRNRKFVGKPACYDGTPEEWFLIGNHVNILFNESEDVIGTHINEVYTRHADSYHMKRRHECNAVTITNYRGEAAGIGQKDIPVQKDMEYEFRIVVKAWQMTKMRIVLSDRDVNVCYDEKEIVFDKKEYEAKTVFLHTAKKDENARLSIAFCEEGTVSIGAVSLMPGNHFHGMRPDVVNLLKELGVRLLRWPGGNFAGEYNWKDGLLPADMRAPFESHLGLETQPHSLGYDFNEINTDDFVALCKEIGAEPFITINPTWNTEEECAQWVEYCNGDADTEYGRIRIERGYKEPYNVKYWSLGNEFGYGHMEGDNTAAGYGKNGKRYGKKMLEVSPDLVLCSSGPYPNKEWAEQSARQLMEVAPMVALHSYVAQPFFMEKEQYEKDYYECIDKVDTQCRKLVHQMREELGDDRLRISFDEWNVWYAWYRAKSVNDGIFTASMLHMLIEEAGPSGIDMACHFEAVNEGAIRVEWDHSFLTPSGKMFSVMKNHIGGKIRFAAKDAIMTEKDGICTVTLINRSYSDDKKFVLMQCGAPVTATLFSSEDVLPHSDFEVTDVKLNAINDTIDVQLPKHSVMLLRLKR